jgi:trans-2-enoyl-CoA reductase
MASVITRRTIEASPSAPLPEVKMYILDELPSPSSGEVLVKFLASPINPLDLLVLAGKYPVQPKHQYQGEAVMGYDGVGQIIRCGPGTLGLQPGDLVVPGQFGLGTWRSHAVLQATQLQKITRPNDVVFSSLLRISVSPAYCLVEDMRSLNPGDYIIQNAGTSVVSQFVTQFANLRGVNVIHVIRDRESAEAQRTKEALLSAGAETVLTEKELANQAVQLRTSRRIVLALDAMYGVAGSTLLQALSDGGTYVHLGFLGGQEGELRLGSGDLFGRRLTLKGFRGSAQMAQRTPEEQSSLFNWWVELFNRGRLSLPVLGINRIEWNTEDGGQTILDAVRRAQNGPLGQRKQVFVF